MRFLLRTTLNCPSGDCPVLEEVEDGGVGVILIIEFDLLSFVARDILSRSKSGAQPQSIEVEPKVELRSINCMTFVSAHCFVRILFQSSCHV
jgi:hypothetical protein